MNLNLTLAGNKQNCRRGIIGPFFFENEQGEPLQSMAIVIGLCWTNFCSQELKRSNIGNISFQQDGATCHTAEAKLDVLRSAFEYRIISRKADVKADDLATSKLRFVPSKISVTPPETIDALKDNIREIWDNIQWFF